ncbi:MAG: hypothetical protein IPP22_15415 [Nitrosomonas sp.]|nr:hypothetical protein [Nitrosomonas sp.]
MQKNFFSKKRNALVSAAIISASLIKMYTQRAQQHFNLGLLVNDLFANTSISATDAAVKAASQTIRHWAFPPGVMRGTGLYFKTMTWHKSR